MTDLHDTHDLEDLYGPLYRYSDHKHGERMSYRDRRGLHHGVILWICAPGPVVEGHRPRDVHYMVEAEHQNWPDVVFPSDVVVDETPTDEPLTDDEPTLARCPYCG